MSRSPDSVEVDQSSLQAYQESWEAIYNLIDAGSAWSGEERNCAFLNVKGGRFADISAASGLDFEDDGRALAVADWDFDGRLDFWITNRTAPRVRFLHNEGDGAERFVAFRLEGKTCNRDAIGARLELTAGGSKQMRTLHAGDGYLAQSSKWVHFGLGESEQSEIENLVVRWPGGVAESFGGVEAGRFYRLVQGEGQAEEWRPPREGRVPLQGAPLEIPDHQATARTWVAGRVLFPAERYQSWDGTAKALETFAGRPLLINLWSGFCTPCLTELGDWREHEKELGGAGLRILALCVDEKPPAKLGAELPFAKGRASQEIVNGFEAISRALLESRKPLPVPTSILLDSRGLVAAIYKGPVSAQQLVADVALLQASPEEQREASVPFPGRWSTPPLAPMPRQVVGTFMKAGQKQAAAAYTRRCLDPASQMALSPPVRSSLTLFYGDLYLDEGKLEEAAAIYERLFTLAADDAAVHREVSMRLVAKQRVRDALKHLDKAVSLDPTHVDSRLNLASLQMREGMLPEATAHFRELAKQRPGVASLHFYLANALQAQGESAEALVHYREAHRLQPNSAATNNLAWILATHRDDSLRNGSEALALAEEACSRQGFKDPVLLNTLAAAYAETGKFAEAVATAEKALELAKAASAPAELLKSIAGNLASYRAGHPARD